MIAWHCEADAKHFRDTLDLPAHISTAASTLSIRRHPVFVDEPVVMLSDVPHLIKKARNNLEKSASKIRNKQGGSIRHIMVRGNVLWWSMSHLGSGASFN